MSSLEDMTARFPAYPPKEYIQTAVESSLRNMSTESSACSSKVILHAQGIKHLLTSNPKGKLTAAVLALVYYRCRSHYFQKQQEKQELSTEKGDWDNDLDDEVRECTITLVSRGMFLNQAHHLSVQFDFDGGHQVTYEAFEHNGKLQPYFRLGPADGEKTEIGTLTLSPKELNSIAKKNKFNWQKYSLLFMNCQTWIIELLISLKASLITIAQYIQQNCAKMELLLQNGSFTAISGGVDLLYALYLSLRIASENGQLRSKLWESIQEECTSLLKPVEDAVKMINTRLHIILHNILLLFTDPAEFFRRVFK